MRELDSKRVRKLLPKIHAWTEYHVEGIKNNRMCEGISSE